MGSPELARDLRALAITTRDLRRRVGREHGLGPGGGLDGRPIPADTEVWVSNGMHLGGYSGAGVKGDLTADDLGRLVAHLEEVAGG